MRMISLNDRASTAAIKMGLEHGKDFDCGRMECRLCSNYRQKDQEEFNALSDDEKRNYRWGSLGH